MNQVTNQQIANSYTLWVEYFDVDGTMSEAEFNDMTVEARLYLVEQAFGQEA